MNTSLFPARRARRGSVLIVSLIFAAIIAISLTSYIKMSSTALSLSNRSFNGIAAMNLADTGLEQAVWSFNQATAGSGTAWSSWTVSGNNATRTFTGFSLPHGATAAIKVYVQDYNSSGTPLPLIVAKSIVTPASGPVQEKWVEVTLRRRSLFATGLVAKDEISFTGNTGVDSWNSDPDNSSATAAIAYSAGVAHDKGSVGSVSVTSDVSVQNADIYGYASVGGPSTTAITVGPTGRVGPYGTAAGVKDPSRVASDFTASLDDVTQPTTSGYALSAINSAITLPRGGDTAAADGKYYYDVPSISLNGNASNKITVSGKVVLRVTNTVGTVLNLGGNASLTLDTNAALEVYTAGNVDLGGNGVINGGTTAATMNQPINFQLWGTKATSALGTPQSINIHGNGAFSGIIYAPFASLSLDGGGNSGGLWGSAVAKTISVVGNQNFHYDESLANYGSNNPFGITKWRELVTAADRAAYASVMSF
jgi:Tfp pilus assembly protein PilX